MKEYTIKIWVKMLAWLSAFIIVGLNIQLVIQEISSWISDAGEDTWWIYLLIFPAVAAVLALLIYVTVAPFFKKTDRQISVIPHGNAFDIGQIEDVVYQNIGITVDFSESDKSTLRHALIQGGKSARYLLIHVVETAGARFHGDKVLDLETQSDTNNLSKYQENLNKMGYNANIAVGYGAAAQAISGIVKENNLDLLVMGAHGHKGISDLIFGTTVETVRHKVNIPVLIIK